MLFSNYKDDMSLVWKIQKSGSTKSRLEAGLTPPVTGCGALLARSPVGPWPRPGWSELRPPGWLFLLPRQLPRLKDTHGERIQCCRDSWAGTWHTPATLMECLLFLPSLSILMDFPFSLFSTF